MQNSVAGCSGVASAKRGQMNATMIVQSIPVFFPGAARPAPAYFVERDISLEQAITRRYIRLARGVVRQAVHDARIGTGTIQQDAAQWLRSDYAQDMAVLAGFDYTLIARWLDRGCPKE